MSAVVTPGFGPNGDQYAAVCGEGHTPPWKSATGTAPAAMRAATHHNQVLHPDTLPTELDIDPADSMEHVVRTPSAIFHLARCESCMCGSHFEPPQWHSWAGGDDIAHAKATGQDVDRIRGQRCACTCAGADGTAK